MTIELVSVLRINEGKEAEVTIELREGDKSDRRQFLLPATIFDSFGIREGEISREDVMTVMDAEERYRALKRAFDIIGYGRNSTKVLEDKLRHRGFKPEICRDIAEYMRDNGYIDEDDDAMREVDVCVRKLWGGRRILMHLHEKGYDNSAINVAKEYLSEVDFVELCVSLIRAKFGTIPKAESERNKIMSSLIRYGYSTTEIKNAAKIIERYVPED